MIHQKRIAAGLAGTIGALLVGGTLAWASIPDSSGVINGCYAKSNGALRVIDTSRGQKCTTKETGLNWNQTGPPGLPGMNGVTGFVQVSNNLTDTNAVKQVTVECPTGKYAIGGGAIAG